MSAVALAGSKKEQIKQLLQANCSITDAAATVGCEVSYVSQLMTDEEFAKDIITYRILNLQEQTNRDKKYDSLEDKLLAGLELKLEQGMALMKTETILRAIQAINGAKRRGAVAEAPSTVVNNVINLTLPSHIVRQFQVNPQNEVITVGEKNLISMPASRLLEKVKEVKPAEQINETLNTPLSVVKEFSTNENEYPNRDLSRRIEKATISADKI